MVAMGQTRSRQASASSRARVITKAKRATPWCKRFRVSRSSLEDDPNVAEAVAKVGAAFDVEKVTKKFYDLFKKEHDAFLKFTKGIPDEKLQRWYASVMLNRLMFIYFIQKKGFLGGDQDYLRTKLRAVAAVSDRRSSMRRSEPAATTDRFYRDFLCPLFFRGLCQARGAAQSGATNSCWGASRT